MINLESVNRFLKEAHRFAAVAEMSNVLFSHTLCQEILQTVVDLVPGIMEAEVCAVYLTDERTGELRLEVARGLAGQELEKMCLGDSHNLYGVKVVNYPLKFKNKTYGMLTVGRISREWSDHDLAVLALFSRLVAGAIDNNQYLKKMRRAYLDIVKGFSVLIESREQFTQGHSDRVAKLAVSLAGLMGLPEETIIDIEIAGIIHDIGKLGVPESLLNKHAKLTREEYEVVKKHTIIGADMLGSVEELKRLAPYVQFHHERYDGSGYPEGLKGSQIPLEVQIVGIADVYEALTSPRTYREALSTENALNIIKNSSGKWFNPELVENLERLVLDKWGENVDITLYCKKFPIGLYGPEAQLTPREKEILALLAEGLTNKEIAQKLFIAERTVKCHLTSILKKLDLPDRTKAAVYAIRQGITG
ncbi:MAG: HD domain-containing phosphohydrolase [Bacillota bacterium]